MTIPPNFCTTKSTFTSLTTFPALTVLTSHRMATCLLSMVFWHRFLMTSGLRIRLFSLLALEMLLPHTNTEYCMLENSLLEM